MSYNQILFSNKPQINVSCPSTGRMWIVSACAFLCILQSALSDGAKSFVIALVAVSAALLTEFFLTWRTNGTDKIKDGSAATTALILSMMLPNQIHPVFAALGSVFAIIVIKYSFGGLGSNWLNPALGGWLFVRFSWPAAFANAVDLSSISVCELAVTSDLSGIDNSVTGFFNNYIFSIIDVQIPSGYIDLLFNNNPGIITDRGLMMLLIGTIVITSIGINRGWIPVVFLAVYGFLIRLAGGLSDAAWNGDLLYGFFSGGTIAAAFILAAEPSSSAKLKQGVIFCVVLTAVLSWFFRYKCMEFYGCFIALALVNCLTPIIRLAEDKIFFSRNKCNSGKTELIGSSGIRENVL